MTKEIRVRAYAQSKPWAKRTKFLLPNALWVLLFIGGIVSAAVLGPAFTKSANVQGVTVAEKSVVAANAFDPNPMFMVNDYVNMTTTFKNGYTGSVYLKLEVQGLPCNAATDSTFKLWMDNPPGGAITFISVPSKDAAGVACGAASVGNAWFFDTTFVQGVAGDYALYLQWDAFPASSVTYSVTANA